jgi:hypothetical protein
LGALILSAGLPGGGVRGSEVTLPQDSDESFIDLAICLDVSGSMQDLIDAARIALWDVVNDLSEAEPTPRLRVALLTYGNRTNGKNGWARVETDLTSDLDLVSERLFLLGSDKGGVEYVGRVLKMAVEDLSWTDSDHAVKLIFVAGNEPADQDPDVHFLDMSNEARLEGISVHAIFCGDGNHSDADTWKEFVELAQGHLATIDLRTARAVKETPYDKELAMLSQKFTQTYVPLDEEGQQRLDRLAEQDQNASQFSSAAVAGRAEAKISKIFSSGWDLIDQVEAGQIDPYELEAGQLPESLREMSSDELALYVDETVEKRRELRERIAELGDKRRQHVVQQLGADGVDPALTLYGAMREAIRERAQEEGFVFQED